MTAAELATLGDPFFKLVLKNRSDVTSLSQIENLLQPNPAMKPRVFVVSEHLVSSSESLGRRAVIAFSGSNGTEQLRGNVMFSIDFDSAAFPSQPDFIEAWAWDNKRGRFNYYRMDASGGEGDRKTWKFRGSSEGADLLTATQRRGTCLECHINGGPIMKELFRPWNNWHSEEFKASYLIDEPGSTNVWPVATQSRFKDRLELAERLEVDLIMPSIRRFNTRRINRLVKRRRNSEVRVVNRRGMQTVLEGRRLLKPLFQTTEFNITSSLDKSGVHPLQGTSAFNPNATIRMPASFFLNVDLIAGGGSPGLNGLKISEARGFSSGFTLTRAENKALLETFQITLDSTQPGDANFAWLVPEPGMIDNDVVDQLLRQGIVSAHFLAAVLAMDLERPVLSSQRASLLQFVPEQFDFKPFRSGDPATAPRNRATDLLTQATIRSIEESNPAPGSAAAEFLTLLKSANAVDILRNRVKDYVERVRTKLQTERSAELERLYRRAIESRQAILNDPTLKSLDETGGRLLFPLP